MQWVDQEGTLYKHKIMMSSIKIDVADLERGKGMEPVILVTTDGRSDDVRDKLLKTLFQGVYGDNLKIKYVNQQNVVTANGYPDHRNTIMLYRPEDDFPVNGPVPSAEAADPPQGWVDIVDRLPPVGKLVYTMNALEQVSAHTFTGQDFNTLILPDNDAIVKWYEQ